MLHRAATCTMRCPSSWRRNSTAASGVRSRRTRAPLTRGPIPGGAKKVWSGAVSPLQDLRRLRQREVAAVAHVGGSVAEPEGAAAALKVRVRRADRQEAAGDRMPQDGAAPDRGEGRAGHLDVDQVSIHARLQVSRIDLQGATDEVRRLLDVSVDPEQGPVAVETHAETQGFWRLESVGSVDDFPCDFDGGFVHIEPGGDEVDLGRV